MFLEIHINNHASFHRGKPTIFCMPDIKDSERFIRLCYQHNLNLILLIKKKWLSSTDYSLALAHLVIDNQLSDNACERIISALKQVKNTLATITDSVEINYFMAFSELHVELMATIAASISQNSHIIDLAQSFRDKWIMRKVANEHGIFCPQFILASEIVTSPEHFRSFTAAVDRTARHKGNKVGFIVKPRSFWGSMGVTEYSDRTSLLCALQKLDSPENYLVEEKIQGKLLHVDAAVLKHKIIYQGIGAYACSLLSSDQTEPSHFMWHTMLPDSPDSHRLFEFNQQILQAFNLEYGFTHTEIFIEENTDNLILCETASRPPGLQLFDLHAITYNSHAFDTFINELSSDSSVSTSPIGKKPDFSIKHSSLNCIGIIIFNPPIGKVEFLTSIEEIIDKHVIEWKQYTKNGSYFTNTHYTEKMGYIICSAKNEHECLKYLKNYNSKFNYKITKQD